jgi:hypothetical protein
MVPKMLTGALLMMVTGCVIDADGDGDPDVGPDPVATSCSDYCDHRAECDDEVDVDSCTADCIDNADNCQADEQAQALAELEACAQESCDDVLGCTIDASLECYFGV